MRTSTAHGVVGTVFEAERADPDDVASARTRPGQQPVDAESLQAMADVRGSLERADVVERDSPLDITADDAELVLGHALDLGTGRLRPEQYDALLAHLALARLVNRSRHRADGLADA